MTEEQRAEIKKALIKCAEENEGKNTFTGYVIVSSVCKAGAERIAELEAENERLTVSYETLKLHDEEEIGMLKSENAELKRDKDDLIFIRNQNAKCMCEDKERFIKAKELLKQWLQTSNASSCDNINIVTDTEQFLKDLEK